MKRWVLVLVASACGGKSAVEPGVASGSSVRSPVIDAGVAVPVPAPPAPPSYKIEAPPGGTIVRLAVTPANDAALTIDDANQVRLWPALDGTLAPVAVELPPATTLALHRAGADYVALLGVVGGALHVRIDATGKRLVVTELPAIDGVAAIDTGFVTWSGKHVEWIDLEGKVTRASDTEKRPVVPASTVRAKGSDLVIATPDGPRYLGYAFPLLAPPSGHDARHMVVSGGDNRFLVVTSELTVVGELAPWTPKGEVATRMTWVGDRDWLVEVPSGVVVWTEGAATGQLAFPKLEVAGVDLESHLVLLGSKTTKQLARYNLTKHALEPIAFTGWGSATSTNDVHLIPPSKNRGAQLVITAFDRDTNSVAHGHARWVHDIDHPERGETKWTGVEAWPMAVASSGAVIMNHGAKHWSVVVDGQPQYELPTDVALSDDGTHLLRRTIHAKIELAKRQGDSVVWSVPMPGRDALWQTAAAWAAGQVWLIQPHGIAVLDPATGNIRRAISGWGFELSRVSHPVSTLGRPLAVEVAHRDPPLALVADTRFQKLAREVAAQSSTQVMWWGPVKLDGAPRRVAFLQSPAINGSPLFAYLVELKPDSIVAITAQMWGFPQFQGPFDGGDPTWGTIKLADGSEAKPTIDAPLELHSKWIHASYEHVTFTLERGAFVVVSNSWLERENTGSNVPGKRYAETSDSKSFPAGRRPKVATYKGHTVKFVVSAPSNSATELAGGSHELPITP